MTTRYAYLHGLSSSPLATKATHLRARFEAEGEALVCPDLNVPDFAHLTFDGALSALDAMAAASPDARWRLIGSSMGGYLAARWAELHPRRVERPADSPHTGARLRRARPSRCARPVPLLRFRLALAGSKRCRRAPATRAMLSACGLVTKQTRCD